MENESISNLQELERGREGEMAEVVTASGISF